MRCLLFWVVALAFFLSSDACRLRVLSQVRSGAPLAMVGQEPVTAAQVDLYLGRQGSDLPELPHAVQQMTVHLIAQQRQALQTLRKLNLSVTQEEVDRAIERDSIERDSEKEASADEVAGAMAKAFGARVQDIRDLVEFRLAWKLYLAKHVTEANMQVHFDQQKARFDGTKFKIVMASIAVPAGENAARKAAHAKLSELAVRPAAGDPDATLSDWIARVKEAECEVVEEREVRGLGSLDHAAIDAVLRLGAGELSEPFDTASGVHSIGLLSKTAGQRALLSAKDEVRAHMLVFLLEHLAAQSRAQLPLTSN